MQYCIVKVSSRQGLATLAQLGIFVASVVAVTYTMTQYTSRAIKGNYRDSMHFARDYVLNNTGAQRNELYLKYMPYYVDRSVLTSENSKLIRSHDSLATPDRTGVDRRVYNERRSSDITSVTLPPARAD